MPACQNEYSEATPKDGSCSGVVKQDETPIACTIQRYSMLGPNTDDRQIRSTDQIHKSDRSRLLAPVVSTVTALAAARGSPYDDLVIIPCRVELLNHWIIRASVHCFQVTPEYELLFPSVQVQRLDCTSRRVE